MAYILSNDDILALDSKNLKPKDAVTLSDGTELEVKQSELWDIGNCSECHFGDNDEACMQIACSKDERENKEFKHAIYFEKCQK